MNYENWVIVGFIIILLIFVRDLLNKNITIRHKVLFPFFAVLISGLSILFCILGYWLIGFSILALVISLVWSYLKKETKEGYKVLLAFVMVMLFGFYFLYVVVQRIGVLGFFVFGSFCWGLNKVHWIVPILTEQGDED